MNTVIIHIFDRNIACYAPSCISDDGFLYLGSYETEEKALKVLDTIQEAYINGYIDFQMPEDSEGGSMSDEMTLIQNKDGAFGAYDDAYDIVIHCESKEEQEKAIEHLKSTNWIPVSERLPEEHDSIFAKYK